MPNEDCSHISVKTMGILKPFDFKTLKVMTLKLPNGEFHNVVVVDDTGQIERMELESLRIVSLKP